MADSEALTQLTADITARFVANNAIPAGEVAGVIKAVYAALVKVENSVAQAPEPQDFVGAVTVRKSLADPAKIISMIDGKPYSMLKRHLGQHGLTPAEYRARYKLPVDYPMTAPAYSETRKVLAVKSGLGRKPAAVEAPAEPISEPAPAKSRRKLGISVSGSDTPAPAPKPRRSSGNAASAKGEATPE